MFVRLLLAFGLTCITVTIHGFGTYLAMSRLYRTWHRNMRLKQRPLASGLLVFRMVGILLLLHLIEAGVWAWVYLATGTLPDLETAVYFSLTSYTTLGYGDVVLPVPWRLFGPFEGAVGILMFGWSTGIMVATISTIYGERFRQMEE